MTTTKEDRERAVAWMYGDKPTPQAQMFIEGVPDTILAGSNTASIAAAFAAHRLAAVAGERERVAKMIEDEAATEDRIFGVTRASAAPMLRSLAAEIRSGR